MPGVIRKPEGSEATGVRLMWEESFPEGGARFTDWYFSRIYQNDFTLGLFENGELVSSLQMVPYTLSLRGKTVRADTLSGVATRAHLRNRGHARALMAEALRDMGRRCLGFTFLYPFSHGFYQRLGWETCSVALEYFKPVAELPASFTTGWSAERLEYPDVNILSRIYDKFITGRNCRTVRSEAQWARRIGETAANGGFVLLTRRQGEPAAYALCEEREEDIEITELAYLQVEAVNAVLAALKPHGWAVSWTAPQDDRAYLLPGIWKDRVRLQPHVMFRVTDVPLAFSQSSPACDGEFIVEVTGDNMVPENDGRYLVKAEGGLARSERTDREPQFSCGIATLARILTGFMDVGEAVQAGLAQGDENIIMLLNSIYPKQNNFLFELY